jgi:group II intron reverse transcriptase/maturase
MQTPETISSVYHERGKRRLPLERVYRQLFNPALYLAAYAKLSQNAGALTPGVTDETIDGMAMERIHAIIQALREERYEWKPARRLFIEKKDSTKKRPLVLPTWSDKLLQEVMRMLLDPYFEPQFSDRSHGFRPDRGCHTALQEIRGQWKGTVWFIEGDISQCFGSLNHEVLLSLLKETIHDGRFLGLLEQLLKAGSLEEWTRRSPLSGAPQGGVLSPLLANIYLDRLDQFVDQCLVPAYTGGETQKRNPAYLRLKDKARSLRKQGRYEEACRVRQEMQAMPSRDTHDSGYRRLRYIRYADDFLIGLTGPREEAEQIKERLRLFLSESLKLTLSEEKTVITHGTSEEARFLGYEVVVQRSDTRQDSRGHRTINGSIGLRVPKAVVLARCAAYQRHGEPTTRPELLNDEVFSIVAHYQAEYRGVVE